jgi:transposase-like protein
MVENFAESCPKTKWRRCVVRFYRPVCTAVTTGKLERSGAMFNAIHSQEHAKAAQGACQITPKVDADGRGW